MVSNDASYEVAKRSSRPKVLPMSASKGRLGFKREFTAEQYDKISLGLIPKNMDDKWFIFMEDDWLYVYRASRAFCIYQLRFAQHGDKHAVAEAWVNRDKSQYAGLDDEYDSKMLAWLIDQLLLGENRAQSPLPERTRVPAEGIVNLT